MHKKICPPDGLERPSGSAFLIKHVIILAVLTSCLQGCATISERREVLSIDSNPRGAQVFLKEDSATAVGKTPLWLETSKSHSHTLWLQAPAMPKQKVTFTCHFDWLNGLLGNGILVLASPWIGAGGLAIDALDGNAFKCGDDRLNFDVAIDPNSPPVVCRTFLVVPPRSDDEKVSDFIATTWTRVFASMLKGCDRIVPYHEAKEVFAYLNRDNYEMVKVKELRPRHLAYIGAQTHASHLILLRTKTRNQDLEISPEFYDLHTTKKLSVAKTGSMYVEKPDFIKSETGFRRELASTMRLIPNAFLYSTSSPDDGQLNRRIGNQDIVVLNKSSRASLSRLASAVSVTSVEHPLGYSNWDIAYDLYPSGSFKYSSDSYRIKVLKDGEGRTKDDELDYRLTFWLASMFYNAGVTFHTPVGAFGTHLGLGPAINYINDSQGLHKVDVTVATSYAIEYTGFLTANVFCNFGAEVIYPQHHINSPYFSRGSWTDAYAGIGYFFPDMRHYVRDLF